MPDRATGDSIIRDIFASGGDMGARMWSHDWRNSPLGPIESWPQSLRTSVSTCLSSRFAILIWWGPELVMLYNDSYTPITGSKHPKALGSRGKEVWPEVWDIIGPMLTGVMATGEATWADDLLLLLDRNGYPEECYFTFSYSPIRDESGGVGGVFTPVFETTDRVIVERRLRTSHDLAAVRAASSFSSLQEACDAAVKVLAENAHDLPFAAIYLFDKTQNSAKLAASTGIKTGSPLLPQELSLDARGKESGWIPLSSLASGEIRTIDLHMPGEEDLPTFPWGVPPSQAIAVPMLQRGKEVPVGFLLSGINPRKRLTDEYRAFYLAVADHIGNALREVEAFEQERQRTLALAELDRAKTGFFSNISHEFRTPLTLMLGPLEEILAKSERDLLPDNRRLAELAHRNGARLLKLVNALLDFSRIEAGRSQVSLELTDVAAYTAELASVFRSAADKAGLTLEVVCPPLKEPVYLDRAMWEKIVLNLLSNAFKFTLEGSITVSVSEADGFVLLEVSDTGTGIAESEVARVFERFHRVEGAQGRSIEGTGIGLALVQELVKLHGGSTSIRSKLGEGTTFTVSIPAERLFSERPIGATAGATTPVSVAPSFRAESYVEEVLGWLPTLFGNPGTELAFEKSDRAAFERDAVAGSSILVVDDNADMREYLGRLLAPEYKVNAVANGAEALAAVKQAPPDLIVTDIMMPVLDGFGLLKALREQPATRAIPVLMLSARSGEEARLEGLESGADDYLVKPFTARDLLTRVKAHLQISKLRLGAAGREQALRAEVEAERNKLRDLFQQAPSLIFVLSGPEHLITLINQRGLRMLGRVTDTDLVGRTLRQAMPEFEGQAFFDLLDEVYRTGVPFVGNEIEANLDRRESGQSDLAYFNFVYQPARDANGNVEGIMVHAVEITEQVLARKQIQESERRLRFMAESMPQKIFTAKPNGDADYHNRQWVEFTGLSPEEIKDSGWVQFIHPEDVEESVKRWRQCVAEGEPFEMEQRFRGKDGNYRWHLSRSHPMRDSDGQILMWLGSSTDIHEQKQAEAALRKNEKLAVAGRLAASISHEINNPLASVMNLLYLMKSEDRLGQLRSYAKTAEEELARVSHIVTHTLQFHRQPTVPTLENLSTLLEETVGIYRGRLANSSIRLERRFAEIRPVVCFAAELRQVFANILGNAFDATRKGGRILLRTRERTNPHTNQRGVQVTIADTGHGMDETTRKRLFEPFFTTKGNNGTGLGLWISAEILHRHQGSVRIRSSQAKDRSGTVVSMFFPYEASVEAPGSNLSMRPETTLSPS